MYKDYIKQVKPWTILKLFTLIKFEEEKKRTAEALINKNIGEHNNMYSYFIYHK